MNTMPKSHDPQPDLHAYQIADFNIAELTSTFIFRHSADLSASARVSDFIPEEVSIDRATFREATPVQAANRVEVRYDGKTLMLHCTCVTPKRKLCEHQRQVLSLIMNREELRIFFDGPMRQAKLATAARHYGMEQEQDLSQFFTLEYDQKSVHIKPKLKGLVSFNTAPAIRALPQKTTPPAPGEPVRTRTIVVLSQHKYYGHFFIELFIAPLSKEGKVKAPLTPLDPMDLIWKTEKPEETKFFAALSKFHSNFRTTRSETDVTGLQALVRNPLQYDFYFHNAAASANITVGSLVPIQLRPERVELDLTVRSRDIFYEASLLIRIGPKHLDVAQVDIRYDHFMMVDNKAYLIEDADLLAVLKRFKESDNVLLVHKSKLPEFHHDFLARYERKVNLSYPDMARATARQLKQNGFDEPHRRIIYLSDSGDFIEITPVLTYGSLEVPVLSRRQILSVDQQGKPFTLKRDEEAELQFAGVLIRQHPDFEAQLEEGLARDFLYIHKKRFLENDWFLDAFEAWRALGISILGFNTLAHNNLNPFKSKITIRVSSGVDWFNTNISVKFDKQQVSLKHLQRSIRNKNRFIQLDDGTLGILPEEWMAKFERYFEAGEITADGVLRTPVSRFSDISSLYDQEQLTPEASSLLSRVQQKAGSFETIDPVAVPEGLMATLRPYQQQGLNWLGFLDDFNFGGCLADDMGLGKTLQIIAFILSQRTKQKRNTNLVVVPASLIYNWQEEVQKFAPSLRVLTLYGTSRVRDVQSFDGYEIILTSYTTLLADVVHLKEYAFNYIFLDESQAIKNPDSQRYKAARLLNARNRVALSGTPIENNTFDLYGQLSFACPGLLGTLRHFRDHYAIPIDKFKSMKHTKALQRRINPFILRRTKEQVAAELPEKTEMIVHCEMGPEQRKVYDACEREFRDFLESTPEDKIAAQSMHILQGLTKLRQLCNSPAIIKDDEYFGNESAKIDTLIEHIENQHVHHKILVFSQFVTMLDLIRIQLGLRNIPFQYLTGQTRNRAERIKDFQHNPHTRVFLISLKAGGTGLNLTAADYVYLVDPWWNPAVENQAIDRAHRIGQHKNVVAVRLICPNTIEEKILKLQETKRDLVGSLIHSDASILKSLTSRDLLELLQ
ncbi:DEAD/DEAH box helicase [Fulvivirgaceae bacterium PWU37]|uniref:DEAD/DEAH box helicase n=2 Tax=Dawidia soli TaxID=2782352 RepID=A0AAP2GKA7_9BACT|nr:DEAD/DEAH box helicase [Dawidia soli]